MQILPIFAHPIIQIHFKMKKLLIFIIMATVAFAMTACNNSGKTKTTEVVTPNASEDLGKALLENFYQKMDEVYGIEEDYTFVDKYLTPKAKQYLIDAYDYECPEGEECMALWLFLYEGGADTAGNYNRTIEKIDDLTYRVINDYQSEDDSFNYQYTVKIGLVKDGDTYKIDSIS